MDENNPEKFLTEVLKANIPMLPVNMGKEKAHASAANTMKEVNEILGFKHFHA